MRAAVLHAPGDIRVEEVPVPEPGPNDALVRVAACGVCGSDIPRMLRPGGSYHLPLICGHEFSGHVVALGDELAAAGTVQVGDLVTVPPLIPCEKCGPCQQGNFSLCEDYDYFGSRRPGAYAQYATVPARNLMVLPADLDPRAAAMLDPAAIALHAVWRTRLRSGHRVAVVGAGPIGLFAVQWARIAGAAEVLAIDLNEQKTAMAREAGATHTAASPEEARELAGAGYDVIIESAGVPPTIEQAVTLTARHGEAVFIGIPHDPVVLPKSAFGHFLRREVTLHGAWNSFSAPFPGDEWRTAARAMASGALAWKFMITHELGLDALPGTMHQLGDRSVFSSKVLFLPNED
ncbi:galactitol-1-phosphate 5-dehydrogenase [Marinitenerispora sediminis]|uniref:Galactitol-1-phosphate 5-dehydrogenase n=2 Tax=Marinitenerispora sediminis TaxID=1931232 RepID=A0A368T825_9ACTN|nr:galactitol-1-phosphate 5-dehydrogenase [Marinitenerispora sediminis]RCV58375.1 galactitol-1-phosphate 5-dehydrogenase [Marinitenerispora sediminis]RCV59554.1 galactitol-1-phosphate 5-dehydrogenase [Marinitenerispora sediminis]